LKLKTKLIVSFACVIGLLLIIGGTSQYLNNRIKNQVIEENRQAVMELEISGQMESDLYQSLINAKYYLDEPYRRSLNNNQNELSLSIEKIKSNVRASLQEISSNLQLIEPLFREKGPSQTFSNQARDTSLVILDDLKNGIKFYNSLIEQALSYGEENIANGGEFLVITVEPFFRNSLLPKVDQFRTRIQMNLEQQEALLNSRLNRYSNILMVAIFIAFLLAIIVAYVLYKSITIPIKSLANATQEIGRGNLKKRIPVKTDDEIGQLATSFNRMAENLNKTTFSKEYVDDIIESMGDALIVTNEQALITKVNSATNDLLGYSDELINQPLSIFLTGKDAEKLMSLGEDESMDNYETQFVRKDGTLFPVSLSKAIIHNNDGSVQGLVCVASDISERKKSEETIKKSLKEKEILLAEIHHRVKNNLAVISGIIQMQIWDAENESAEEVLQDSQMRVKSIALVHEKLYKSKTLSSIKFDNYIQDLINGIKKTYNHSEFQVTFETDIEPINFNINQAITCSLLLNELIVNAYKHAFDGRNEGTISIAMQEVDDLIILELKDDGIGVDGYSIWDDKQSLGMSLVKTLVQQLKGDIEEYGGGGASYKISFKREQVI